MYIVYLKGDSEIYKTGFTSWTADNKWGVLCLDLEILKLRWNNVQQNNTNIMHLALLTLGLKVV